MNIATIKETGLTQKARTAIHDYIKSLDPTGSAKLPREEELAQMLGVSRPTVRAALNDLATEGLIFRRHGKGTFINPEALRLKVLFSPIDDVRNIIAQSGFSVRVETVKSETRGSTQEEAAKLQLDPGEKVVVLHRFFRADEHPAIYCIDRIAAKYFPTAMTVEDLEMSIYLFIKTRLRRTVTWDKVELSVVTCADLPDLEAYFTPRGKPFLNCDIVNFDENDVPVCYANEYYDTNLIRFNLIRQKKFT